MKLIKVICYLLILSSCSGKYIGTIDPNYIPTNPVEEIFNNELVRSSNLNKYQFNNIIYPNNRMVDFNISNSEIQNLANTDNNSNLLLTSDNIYYSHKKKLHSLNKKNFTDKSEYLVDLAKDEIINGLYFRDNQLYLMTNKTSLYLLENDEIRIIEKFNILNNSKYIYLDDKIIVFSLFDDFFEINLSSLSISNRENFESNNGFSVNSNSYFFNDYVSYLYNSATLLLINKNNYKVKKNFYLEDLNILSSSGIFNELIDSPFMYKKNFYFIDSSGLLAVFDPLDFKILWEVNLKSPIIDYLFSEDGNILILTIDEVYIFDQKGSLLSYFPHQIENPLNVFIEKNNLSIVSNKGIYIFDYYNGTKINFLENKFINSVNLFFDRSSIYLKDEKNLFILSE